MLKALTIDRSVMHVDVAGDIALPNLVAMPFDISEQGFERLLDFIDQSFERSGSEPKVIPDAGYGETDRFLEAIGQFNAVFGCNSPTAEALRAVGLQTGWWMPLPMNVRALVALHN